MLQRALQPRVAQLLDQFPAVAGAVRREEISLGIVCPMANESSSAIRFVEQVLLQCTDLKQATLYVVLDRVSRDGTRELLEEFAREQTNLHVVWAPENRCVVDAYVRGYREALANRHDYILEIDGGFSHQPEDIPKFLDAMEEGYDCVFGSRFISGGMIDKSSLVRKCISVAGSRLTNLLAGTNLRDMTSGFELFSRSALEMVLARGIQSRAHFFQTEIKYYCRHLNITEVPITYRAASPSVGKSSIEDAFRNLWKIARFNRNKESD